jgi:excinuclease UvrABC nuclease subunit
MTKGKDKNRIIPLYVGKAVNLWNRMQTHWCRPEVGGWVDSYLKEIENGTLDEIVMACAWKEEERAAFEARLIKILKPRFCRRTE